MLEPQRPLRGGQGARDLSQERDNVCRAPQERDGFFSSRPSQQGGLEVGAAVVGDKDGVEHPRVAGPRARPEVLGAVAPAPRVPLGGQGL